MATGNIFIYLFTLDAVNWDSRGYILGEGYIFVSIKEDIELILGTRLGVVCHLPLFFIDAVFLFLLVDT